VIQTPLKFQSARPGVGGVSNVRIVQSRRGVEGINYFHCPITGEKVQEPFLVVNNVVTDCCGHCRVERLQSRFRVYNDQAPDNIKDFEPVKAYDTQGKYTGRGVLLSPRHSCIEPKLDGVRAFVHCTPDGIFVTSRRRDSSGRFRQYQDNIPHIRDHPLLNDLGSEGYTILDSELLMPDEGRGTCAATVAVTNSLPDTAVAHQLSHSKAWITVFDIPWWANSDMQSMPLRFRKALLHEINLNAYEHLHEIPIHMDVDDIDERERILQMYLMEGYEGIVLKDPNSGYRDTRAWLKLKDEVTLDVQVVGWERGRAGGKWENSLGALFCAVRDSRDGQLVDVCDVMPGDDDTRLRLFETLSPLTTDEIRERHLILEIKGQQWTDDGHIRHPRIVRWREDKSEPNELDLSHVYGKNWEEVPVNA
jgi:ATP-dependent DNA ligase